VTRDRNLVLFDGACGVCSAAKDWAHSRDTRGELGFVAYQVADLDRVAPGLTLDGASQALHFVRRDGRRFRGARATFETLKRLPGGWGMAGTILSLPPLSLLAEPFYWLFARHRGAVSQRLGLDRCALPSSDPS
jgi:predicted DCC family thiol-disulfide oxidoreductase YuxK